MPITSYEDRGKRPPERPFRAPRTPYTTISGISFLVTIVAVAIGLAYEAATTRGSIQGLLVLLDTLWVLSSLQGIRLAAATLSGSYTRSAVVPTDHLFSQDTLTTVPSSELEYATMHSSTLHNTSLPPLPSLSVLIMAFDQEAKQVKRSIESVKTAKYSGAMTIALVDTSRDASYRQLAEEMETGYESWPVQPSESPANLSHALGYVVTDLVFIMSSSSVITDPNVFVKMISIMDNQTAIVQAMQKWSNMYASRVSEATEIENIVQSDVINAHSDKYGIAPCPVTNSLIRTRAARESGWSNDGDSDGGLSMYGRLLLGGWKTARLPSIVTESPAPMNLQTILPCHKTMATDAGRAFRHVGIKLLGKGSVAESLNHWCDFTKFSFPLSNLIFSALFGVFALLQYWRIYTLPLIPILVVANLAASSLFLMTVGGRKHASSFLKMLSMNYLLVYVLGLNFIKGSLGAQPSPAPYDHSGRVRQLVGVGFPVYATSAFFMAIFVVALMIPEVFYAAFAAFNALFYAYSLTALS